MFILAGPLQNPHAAGFHWADVLLGTNGLKVDIVEPGAPRPLDAGGGDSRPVVAEEIVARLAALDDFANERGAPLITFAANGDGGAVRQQDVEGLLHEPMSPTLANVLSQQLVVRIRRFRRSAECANLESSHSRDFAASQQVDSAKTIDAGES